MKEFRYLAGVVSLGLEVERCVGCGACAEVCPQQVFVVEGKKARLVDRDGCMECGACANNCPVNAIRVEPGVGCAAYIIQKWWQGVTGRSGSISCC
jgi:NAD-dependent dihydropyrimidine dehydrogenase PreA subunit